MGKKRPAKRSQDEIWQTAKSPNQMYDTAKGMLSPRRKRLFAIACCRSLWGESNAWAGYLDLLKLAERMADSGDVQSMTKLSELGAHFRRAAYPHGVIHLLSEDADRAADAWIHMSPLTPKQLEHIADILREIAVNPHAEIHLDDSLSTWRDGTVTKLAKACYDSNDFTMIGILGDALEEAGCNEPAILQHVRSEQPHYRGCWVVDLILKKK